MVDQLIEPSAVPQLLVDPVKRLGRSVACIAAIGTDGRTEARGTGVFVELDGRQVVVTARHVVEGLRSTGGQTYLMLLDEEMPGYARVRTLTEGQRCELDLSHQIWASPDLDVAILEAPVGLSGARWLDAGVHSKTATKVRNLWRPLCSDLTSLPFFVLGYPNFAHLSFEALRTEVLTAFPLVAYVVEWDDPWEPTTTRAPQIHVEVDARKPRRPSVVGGIEKLMAEQLFGETATREALGGYSGSPLILVAQDGDFMIGILQQGGHIFDAPRAIASAWDDVMAQIHQ